MIQEKDARAQALVNKIAFARQQQPVASPCIDVCKLHPETGLCEGCLRDRSEIKAWKTLDDRARLRLLDSIETRIE